MTVRWAKGCFVRIFLRTGFGIMICGILRPEAAWSITLWPEATGSILVERTLTLRGLFAGDAQYHDL